MKIGIMLDKIVQGGVPKACLEEARCLRRMGDDSELLVITREDEGEYRYEDLRKGTKVNYISDAFPKVFQKSFKFPGFTFFSSFHVISPFLINDKNYTDCDVLVSHGTYTCFTAKKLCKKFSINYVPFVWDPISFILPQVYSDTNLKYALPFFKPLGKYLDGNILQNCEFVITPSTVHKKTLESMSGKDTFVVHPGCYSSPKIPKRRGNFILSVTKWGVNKKPDILIDICKNMDEKMKIIVAGFWLGNSREEFEKKVKKENLEKYIEIRGPADKQMLKHLYSNARVLMHPLFEAFGMMCLEAAAYGCPFIIPEKSGVMDLFEHEKSAFSPQENNVESFIEYTNKLVKNERYAWRIGKRAWNIANKNTWEDHTRKLK